MIVKGVRISDLERALESVNKRFDDNVTWNRCPEYIGSDRNGDRKYRLTLRVLNSHGPGARLSIPFRRGDKQRHMVSACWHVHGYFMDALPEDATIQVSIRDGNMEIRPGDRWHDWDCGSLYYPTYASELCECA